MVIHPVCGVEREVLLVHSVYFLNGFLFVPYASLPHCFRVKSGGMQSLIPIAENPDALFVQMSVVILEMPGKDLAVLFMDLLHRSNPFGLAVRVIATTRTLYPAKILRYQFIRRKMIFLHVGFTVGVVL